MRRLIARAFIAIGILSLLGCIPPGSLTYPGPQLLRIGVPVTLSPTVKGGMAATFMVSPALPKGLSLNSGTGVISGTPSLEAPRANYVITASNRYGRTSFALELTVLPVPPSNLQYTSPQALTVGQSINLLPSVTGLATSYTVIPALPAGLALNPASGVITGTASTESALATYTITAANAGGSTGFPLEVSVVAAPPLPKKLKLYSATDDPRLISFETETLDEVTFLGQKDTGGNALTVSDLLVRAPDNQASQIVNDSVGRPVLARLSDGSRISFEWLSDSRVIATATTADGVVNYSTEFNLAAPDAQSAVVSIGKATSLGKYADTPVMQASDAPISNSEINVVVTSFGDPVSDAEVRVVVTPITNLSATANYLARETLPGIYATPFVNSSSAIPLEAVFAACSSVLARAADFCEFGYGLPEYMLEEGCDLLGTGLAIFTGPSISFGVSCRAAFIGVKASCEVALRPTESAEFCESIVELVDAFDPTGVDVLVSVRKNGVSVTKSVQVSSGQSLVNIDVELPLPRYLHGNLTGIGNTTLTTELNGVIVRVCEYVTTAPVELTLDFTGSSPRARLVDSTFNHTLTSGNCTPVLEGPIAGTRVVSLKQIGDSLSGSAQYGDGQVSISATRENGRVHGTITETGKLVVPDGPRTHTFETHMTRDFSAH